MGFINPVVESDDSDDYIFERERSVSVVFDTLMNQWCINRGKHLFKFACKCFLQNSWNVGNWHT